MKSNTHKMAGTPASNGQLIIPELRNTSKKVTSRRKPGTADPNALSNAGTSIYNPLTGRFIGDKHYYKVKNENGIDLALLERNSHITSFKGNLSEDAFIALPECQAYLLGKKVTDEERTVSRKDWEKSEHDLLQVELDALEVEMVEMRSNEDSSDHTAGAQIPVFTAEPDEVPLDKQSGFSLYNACVKQTNVIDKLEHQVKDMEARIVKDTDLMEELYHVGRKAIVKIDSIIHRIGAAYGINPPPF